MIVHFFAKVIYVNTMLRTIMSNKGIKFGRPNDERIDKIRSGNIGKTVSDETRQKMSNAHKGKSKSGKVNWEIVKVIRMMKEAGFNTNQIQKKFPFLTKVTIRHIIAKRTWKDD